MTSMPLVISKAIRCFWPSVTNLSNLLWQLRKLWREKLSVIANWPMMWSEDRNYKISRSNNHSPNNSVTNTQITWLRLNRERRARLRVIGQSASERLVILYSQWSQKMSFRIVRTEALKKRQRRWGITRARLLSYTKSQQLTKRLIFWSKMSSRLRRKITSTDIAHRFRKVSTSVPMGAQSKRAPLEGMKQ